MDSRIRGLASELKDRLVREGFRAGIRETTKTGLSGDVRLLESTVKPYVIIYVGRREVEGGRLSLTVYSHERASREPVSITYENLEEAVNSIIEIARVREAPVIELAGSAPRIPGDVSHLL